MIPLTAVVASEIAAEFSLLRYFPSDPESRATLVALLMRMCQYEEQARWLAGRVADLYNEWPGPRELRALYCARFKPRDGQEAFSQTFPDGIPAERQVESPIIPSLPQGHVITADYQIETGVRSLAEVKVMPGATRKPLPLLPVGERITEADFAKAREGK